jgi:CTP:molybdopterin cytidylyltransferase MocA
LAFDVVDNPEYGEGCSSSIAAALGAVDPRADVLVVMAISRAWRRLR